MPCRECSAMDERRQFVARRRRCAGAIQRRLSELCCNRGCEETPTPERIRAALLEQHGAISDIVHGPTSGHELF